ncbi:hypothetical protein SAMN05421688_2556 [Poseidonocella pacifica]|uniref:Uncharacterized protein n=1 Tax=Poseidonocella pacifica TaxID=871651 RepID=A0A1I0XWK7_9RHOB|nr:DUF6478 family protein [Poseidonocella pacifica]SFB05037.1 hypothetical protein SAMN05421688_2556 [Poseidonocella pacifica]
MIGRLIQSLALRHWRGRAAAAQTLDPSETLETRARARALQRELDGFLNLSDRRAGGDTFRRPPGTEWAWRPEIWQSPLSPKGQVISENRTAIGAEASLFVDGREPEVALSQRANTGLDDLAPFGLSLDCYHYQGGFLSLVIDIPEDGCAGLEPRHLLRLDVHVSSERPARISSRLNIRQGPQTNTLVRDFDPSHARPMVEFDLAYAELERRPIDRLWLDLILHDPAMNQIDLRDVTLMRLTRAAF